MKEKRCEFHTSLVTFLSYILKSGPVKMDPEKVKAMTKGPTPTTWKQLQHFMGFASFYCQFITNYNQVAAPLTHLTSTSRAFASFPEAECADQLLLFHGQAQLSLTGS